MHVCGENLCEFVYSVSSVFVEGPLLQEEHALRELLCAISFVYLTSRQIYEFQKTSDCIRILARVENSFVTDMSDMHEFRSKMRAWF